MEVAAKRDVTFRRQVDEAALENGIRSTPGVELNEVVRQGPTFYNFRATDDLSGQVKHRPIAETVEITVFRWNHKPTDQQKGTAEDLIARMIERIERAVASRGEPDAAGE